jgi:hypothetical protein
MVAALGPGSGAINQIIPDASQLGDRRFGMSTGSGNGRIELGAQPLHLLGAQLVQVGHRQHQRLHLADGIPPGGGVSIGWDEPGERIERRHDLSRSVRG